MKYVIPMKLPSLANMTTRVHWRKILKIKKNQQQLTLYTLTGLVTKPKKWSTIMGEMEVPKLPLVVHITRVGPRKLDGDNLQSACKYVRDMIAYIVGTDDGSPLYTWDSSQRIGPYSVEVEITPR